MQHVTQSRSKGFFRSSPSSAFDQYLLDIQKLPLITDVREERRLARLAQKGDELAAERLVTANLRFVISYVKKYQGHGLDLSELVAIGNEGSIDLQPCGGTHVKRTGEIGRVVVTKIEKKSARTRRVVLGFAPQEGGC